jgi:hypothetical protein
MQKPFTQNNHQGLHHGKSTENTAPATKYGGKIVVCQPGITEVAKSKDTIVCTDNTSGVLKPANTNDKLSCRCQCFVLPVHPNAATPYNMFTAIWF